MGRQTLAEGKNIELDCSALGRFVDLRVSERD